MAAERLEMTEVEAVRYLAEQLDQPIKFDSIRAYRQSLDFSDRHQKFWAYARDQMRQPTADQLSFLRYLGWQQRSPMSVDRLMDGPARLYGLADPRAAHKYLKKQFRLKEVLAVVPFYRTPTIIGGFACLSPSQEIYTNNNAARELMKGDLGFAGLQFLDRVQSETVVITSMLRNMIQIQMHHFSSNQTPLPMLSWNQAATSVTQRQWSIFDGRQVVLWEREPTAAIIHQAMMCNANLSFVGPDTRRQKPQEVKGSRWKNWTQHDPSIDIYRKIVRNSRPYEQALKNWIRLATSQQRVKLLQDAEKYEENTAKFVRTLLTPKVKAKVSCRITVGTSSTTKNPGNSIRQTTVIERDGKWFSNHGKVRFPGIVRVTHIIVRPSGEREYAGYLRVEDQRFDFHVPKRKADMAWLCNFGLDNGVFLQSDHYKTTLGKFQSEKFNPFEAAMRFEEPQVVSGIDRIGWDGAGFQLKGARVMDGVFHQNPDFKLPKDAPGPKQNYCRMREEVKVALQKDGTEMSVVWAMAIALCAQITAPAVELHPFGIWIHRKQCDLFLQTLYNRYEIWRGDYSDWKHRWPRRLDKWYLAVEKDESGFFVTHYQSSPPDKVQELLVIEANDEQLQPRSITHSADKIVLNYLRHFTQQKHEFPGNWEKWKQHTIEQMRECFDFVNTEALHTAEARVRVI
jgi:hypothetical protein